MAVKTVTFAAKTVVQNWVVPANIVGGTCTVTVKGPGGIGSGSGGLVVGVLAVTPGETLGIYTGCVGKNPANNTTAGLGGFGGAFGGAGGRTTGSGSVSGFGGSGSSEIRRGATRLVVAGGAGSSGRGGYGSGSAGAGGKGGAGTGGTGGTGTGTGVANGVGGTGGTQVIGGTGGTSSGQPGSNAGTGGAGGGSGSTNTRGGGGAGGGYRGGGGGGASSPNRGSGGGGGGSNYTGGLASVTTNSQGGGSAAGSNGVISITYTTPPLRPSVVPPNFLSSAGIYTTRSVSVQWQDSDSPPAQIATSDVQYRPITGGAWTQIMGIAALPSSPYTGRVYLPGGTFTAGDWELQVRLHDSVGNVGAWSDSVLFTVLAPPAAAYPYIDLPDQWPDGPTAFVDAAGMRARIDTPINALARWVADPAGTDPADPTRRAAVGVELSLSPAKGGATTSFGSLAMAANTPIKFDLINGQADGFLIYNPATGLVMIDQPGLYLVGASLLVPASGTSGAVAFINGLPAAYAKPAVRLLGPVFGADIGVQSVRFAGGEQVSLQVDRATNIATDPISPAIHATRLFVWRIGL